jgi:hypothetical protein
MRGFALVVMLVVAVEALGYVDIAPPKIETGAPQRVLERCDGRSSHGCTKFVEVRMLCECLLQPDGWKLIASVKAVPHVYITSVQWLAHEKGHIWDFKTYINGHVNALGKRRFPSRERCEDFLTVASDSFTDTMQRIGRLSAERRDGRRSEPGDQQVVMKAEFVPRPSEDHVVVAEAEEMPKLMDHGVAYLANDLWLVLRYAEDRAAEDGDLVGERRKHVVRPLR